MWLLAFFLIVILMFLVIFAILGDTLNKPFAWGGLATIFGTIYAWILTSWWNFVDFILIPAWNTITLEIVPGVYEFGAVIFVMGVSFYILMMLRTAYISWTRDGVLTLSA